MSDDGSSIAKKPAYKSIYTQGNWFWRGEERFLIKGISYLPRKAGGRPYDTESRVDPLAENRINELRKDIENILELGLNTIQVSAIDPSNDHEKAMTLLADAGIYVLVSVLEDFKPDEAIYKKGTNRYLNFDPASYYTPELLKSTLRIVFKLAKYPNLLGFVVSAGAAKTPGVSKLAEVHRAAVRDIKAYLRVLDGRLPPVGISVNDIVEMKIPMLEYCTAGANEERADFFAPNCFSWANKSNFVVSGWQNQVKVLKKYPVPMFFAAYGAYVGRSRIWEEVSCLYSPDMTGVFSGGCLYTYLEYGNNYGIVKPTENGIEKKPEFELLKMQFKTVNGRTIYQQYTAEVKDYAMWEGNFPEQIRNRFSASPNIASVSGGLEGVIQELEDEQEWEIVNLE